MPNISDKTDNNAGAAGELPAAEFNALKNGHQGQITSTGGSLIDGDSAQFPKSIVSSATIASFFQDDSTVANTIVLNTQGNFQTPVNVPATWNGMLIRFRPKFGNTEGVTVNFAGLNGGNPIEVVSESGAALSPGELSTGRDAFLRYDLPNTRFILINSTLQSAVATLQSQIIPATTTTQGVSYLNKPITLAYNSTTVINYSAGTFQFDDGSDEGVLSAGSIDLATNGIGGLDTGSLAPDTVYYLHAYKNNTTGAFGTAMSTSPTTSTITGWTRVARIRGALLEIDQNGDITPADWFDNSIRFRRKRALLTVGTPTPSTFYTFLHRFTQIKTLASITVHGETGTGGGDVLTANFGSMNDDLTFWTNEDFTDISSSGDADRHTRNNKMIPCTDGQMRLYVVASTGARTAIVFNDTIKDID